MAKLQKIVCEKRKQSGKEIKWLGQLGRNWPLTLRASRKNLLGALLFCLFSGLFFALNFTTFRNEEPVSFLTGPELFSGLYLGLSLLGLFLCFLELRLPEKARYVAGWAMVLIAPLGAFYAVDLINTTRILTFSFNKIFSNYLCCLMVFALFYAVFRRAWAAVLGGGLVFLCFGIFNYFVVQFRGTPILPWDLSALTTAAQVAGGYKFAPTRFMALSLLWLFCTVVFSAKLEPLGRAKMPRKFRFVERGCALGVSAALFIAIFPMNILSGLGISVWAWNQKTSSEYTGITAGFLANIQFLMVDKPQGYSPEEAARLGELAAELEEPEPIGQPGTYPTIITVMNESFTDMQTAGNVTFVPDNLPFLRSLQESGEVVWGTAYSSVYGGNTCNSEYEFLTGNTTAFLPSGSKPYQQYVDCEQTGLPSILKSYGYRCTAIHPGNRGAWQRDTAYPYLGFDEFIAAKDYTIRRTLERGLTTDKSNYQQVIYEYEHRDENQPQFLFNVTIQNHGGFEDEDYAATVQVEGAEGEYPQTEQYLSLIKESDEAFKSMVTYFSKQEDPVVILLFGDHWPSLEEKFLTQLLGADSENRGIEELMRQHRVPFLIWANYPLQGEKIEAVSINYLSGLLLRAAGLPGTAYTKYLENLRQTVPVITAVGSMDQEGRLYSNGDETPWDEALNEYAILQYNNSFDQEEKQWQIFTR